MKKFEMPDASEMFPGQSIGEIRKRTEEGWKKVKLKRSPMDEMFIEYIEDTLADKVTGIVNKDVHGVTAMITYTADAFSGEEIELSTTINLWTMMAYQRRKKL